MESFDDQWQEIPGYPRYLINPQGVIYSSYSKKVLVEKACSEGYSRVSIYNENGRRDFIVHALVAMTFMRDFQPGLQITHKDGDRSNNSIENLRIRGGGVLPVRNYEKKLKVRGGGRVRVVETGQIFLNAYSAARYFKTDPSTIYKCLRQERKRHLGMRFEYVKEGEDEVETEHF